jgi:hypothetical protein
VYFYPEKNGGLSVSGFTIQSCKVHRRCSDFVMCQSGFFCIFRVVLFNDHLYA